MTVYNCDIFQFIIELQWLNQNSILTFPTKLSYTSLHVPTLLISENEIKNGKIRMIFGGGLQFDAQENAKLQEFQGWLSKKGITP
jgi:hypothetical protein